MNTGHLEAFLVSILLCIFCSKSIAAEDVDAHVSGITDVPDFEYFPIEEKKLPAVFNEDLASKGYTVTVKAWSFDLAEHLSKLQFHSLEDDSPYPVMVIHVFADEVIVSGEVSLPGRNVYIEARRLVFRENNGNGEIEKPQIDTSPTVTRYSDVNGPRFVFRKAGVAALVSDVSQASAVDLVCSGDGDSCDGPKGQDGGGIVLNVDEIYYAGTPEEASSVPMLVTDGGVGFDGRPGKEGVPAYAPGFTPQSLDSSIGKIRSRVLNRKRCPDPPCWFTGTELIRENCAGASWEWNKRWKDQRPANENSAQRALDQWHAGKVVQLFTWGSSGKGNKPAPGWTVSGEGVAPGRAIGLHGGRAQANGMPGTGGRAGMVMVREGVASNVELVAKMDGGLPGRAYYYPIIDRTLGELTPIAAGAVIQGGTGRGRLSGISIDTGNRQWEKFACVERQVAYSKSGQDEIAQGFSLSASSFRGRGADGTLYSDWISADQPPENSLLQIYGTRIEALHRFGQVNAAKNLIAYLEKRFGEENLASIEAPIQRVELGLSYYGTPYDWVPAFDISSLEVKWANWFKENFDFWQDLLAVANAEEQLSKEFVGLSNQFRSAKPEDLRKRMQGLLGQFSTSIRRLESIREEEERLIIEVAGWTEELQGIARDEAIEEIERRLNSGHALRALIDIAQLIPAWQPAAAGVKALYESSHDGALTISNAKQVFASAGQNGVCTGNPVPAALTTQLEEASSIIGRQIEIPERAATNYCRMEYLSDALRRERASGDEVERLAEEKLRELIQDDELVQKLYANQKRIYAKKRQVISEIERVQSEIADIAVEYADALSIAALISDGYSLEEVGTARFLHSYMSRLEQRHRRALELELHRLRQAYVYRYQEDLPEGSQLLRLLETTLTREEAKVDASNLVDVLVATVLAKLRSHDESHVKRNNLPYALSADEIEALNEFGAVTINLEKDLQQFGSGSIFLESVEPASIEFDDSHTNDPVRIELEYLGTSDVHLSDGSVRSFRLDGAAARFLGANYSDYGLSADVVDFRAPTCLENVVNCKAVYPSVDSRFEVSIPNAGQRKLTQLTLKVAYEAMEL